MVAVGGSHCVGVAGFVSCDGLPVDHLRRPTSTMVLPQELIDKIIDEVAWNYSRHTLYACSLVQKRWVRRSREHLFQSLSLYRMDDFEHWIKSIPPSPNSLHHHVRDLSYRQGSAILGPKQLLDLYPNHFTSFTRLETLQIFDLSLRRFTPTSMERAFGPVGGSVRELVANDITLTPNSLLMLLVHFPRLQALRIGNGLQMLPENKKRPPNLPNLTGELSLLSMGSSHGQFVLELSKLPLRYSALDLEFRWSSEILNAIAHLILTCSPTLEELTLRYVHTLFVHGTLSAPYSNQYTLTPTWTGSLADAEEGFPLGLKSCALLRKVTIQAPKREAEEHLVRLLGTIRSHKLETIEFIGPADDVQPSTWAMVDDGICILVDELKEGGWKGKLRVMIHYRVLEQETSEDQLLAGFRGKGGVVESVDDRFETTLGSYWYI